MHRIYITLHDCPDLLHRFGPVGHRRDKGRDPVIRRPYIVIPFKTLIKNKKPQKLGKQIDG
jgi:hypothetical protein